MTKLLFLALTSFLVGCAHEMYKDHQWQDCMDITQDEAQCREFK